MADVLNGHNGHSVRELSGPPPEVPQEPEPGVISGVVIQPPAADDVIPAERERLPVVPDPLRRENIRGTVTYWAGLHWHRVRYHALRFPWYVPLFLFYAARGAHRLNKRLWTWWHWTEGWHWESLSVAAGRPGYHDGMRAHVEGKKTRASRGRIVAGSAAGVVVLVLVIARFAPLWGFLALAAAAFPFLVRHGRPAGKPLLSPAVVSAGYQKPTLEIISKGLASVGIKAINDLLVPGGRGLDFLTDPFKDGEGWCTELNLPHGVTAGAILKRREELASGLRRPLSAVWPEGVPAEHEGRLKLWIGFTDLAKMKPKPWPLAKSGKADVFGHVPFGTDPRGRTVTVPLFEVNWLIGAAPGNGKALALDTPVPTPSGWTTMGALRDGDVVFGADGQPCKVQNAWPVREGRPCYEVQFSDGSVIVADAEHQWLIDTRASRMSASRAELPTRRESPFSHDQRHKRTWPQVLTTAQMFGSVRTGADNRLNYSVRVAKPLGGAQADLPIDPYALGAWLGDGTSTSAGFTSADPGILDHLRLAGVTVTYAGTTERPYGYRLGDTVKRPMSNGRMGAVNTFAAALRELGVLGNKHIPVTYLRASEQQRRALLAGLLDTDGTCNRRQGQVQFSVTSEKLARNVLHLAASLGYKPRLRSRTAKLYGKDCGTQWTVVFTTADKVFRLPRKLALQVTKTRATAAHRYITAIRPVASVPVRCITVDSPDSLYLVGEMCIPTHNTSAVRVLALAAALDPLVDLWVHELAGKGDLDALAQVSHRYTSGLDEESIRYTAESLAILREQLERRSRKFKEQPKEDRPHGKITPELAKRFKVLRPVVCILDEAQNCFADPDFGKQAADDAGYVIRLGRAYGIILILATQRPDKDMLPTQVSGNVTARFCLKVPSHVENDLILGTSAHANGYRSTVFRPKTDAGLGWLKGDAEPQIVKTYYIDEPAARRIAARARAMREQAGVLSGYALAEDGDDAGEVRDVRADLLTVMGSDRGLHWAEAAERLARQFPSRWTGATADSVSAEARDKNIPSEDVRRPAGAYWIVATDQPVAKGVRRQDVIT